MFTPINDNILVAIQEQESTTATGIIIPKDSQEKNQTGQVVHPGKSDQLKTGDKVYFKKYIGHALDEKHLILRQEDILGIIHE